MIFEEKSGRVFQFQDECFYSFEVHEMNKLVKRKITTARLTARRVTTLEHYLAA
jgi:hypothetical protein